MSSAFNVGKDKNIFVSPTLIDFDDKGLISLLVYMLRFGCTERYVFDSLKVTKFKDLFLIG